MRPEDDYEEKLQSHECPCCMGRGWDAGHDLPNRHGEDGECLSCPVQIPCDQCLGTGTVETNDNN